MKKFPYSHHFEGRPRTYGPAAALLLLFSWFAHGAAAQAPEAREARSPRLAGPAVKGDFNGDGKADLILLRSDDPICDFHNIWYMSEAQRVGSGNVISFCSSDMSKFEAADDFNGDGQTDVVQHRHTDGQVVVFFHNGTQMIGVQNVTGAAPLPVEWELASTGDFNADGWPDIVWRNTATQKLKIWTLAGTQVTGTIVPNPDQAVDANWKIVGTLDFDGDGARDFLWYNPNSGKIVFWFMDANVQRITGQFANPSNAGDNNWKVVATGDYGVGPGGLADTADIVWQNETSGNIVIWYMDRAGNRTGGTFTNPAAPSPALAWSVIGPR